jgi:hypothetical protein
MSEAIQLGLMLAPLAVYFYVLGIWHSSRRPRVIRGSTDYGMLVFGLSGLILFGPAGGVLLRTLFGPPNLVVWVLWTGFCTLWALFLAHGSGRRLVVYQTDEPTFRSMLENAVAHLPGSYIRTLNGYEDARTGRSIALSPHAVLRVGAVHIEGKEAEETCEALRVALRQEAALRPPTGPSFVTWGFFFFSWLAMVAPMVTLFIHEPKMHTMVRQFLQRLQGG